MKRRLMLVAAGCAATVLVVTGGAASAAEGTASPAPVTEIVYADQSGGIWIVNADGTGNHEISTVTAETVSLSPDGKRIAYEADRRVWILPVGAGVPRQLTPSDQKVFDVAWSPNGKWIAYTVEAKDLDEDIYRIPPGGGSPQRLTDGAPSDCTDQMPAWSPDSTTIAYTRVGGCTGTGLVVQRIGHSGHTVVSGFVESPSFTPVGHLVYLSTCDMPDECNNATVSYESNADGSAPLIIDHRDDCLEGDLCQNGIIGAPREHGWVQQLVYAEEGGGITETCFRGGYQNAGTLMDIPPAFCLSNVLINSYDVA